jgi:hypothetical protein
MFTNRFQVFFLLGLVVLTVVDCKKKKPKEDIQDCDKIYNYYEDGVHYIRRDLVQEDGVLDYEKLLEDAKPKRSDCFPGKDQNLKAPVDIEPMQPGWETEAEEF